MNIADVLKASGVRVWEPGAHHHVGSDWIGVDCPRCSRNTNRVRLGFSLSGAVASCWNCGRFNVVEILAELTGMTRGEAFKALGGVDFFAPVTEQKRGKLVLPKGIGPMLSCHRKYLRGRGFNPRELERLWGLQGIGLAARFPWRIFIPVHDERGAVASWTTRALADNVRAKYGNARPTEEAVPAKSMLYGMCYVRHSVIVHEGPADVWRTGPGAVATMGMAYSREQVLALSKIPIRHVCFDSSPEAQRRASKLCDALSVFDGETSLIEIDATDPGSAGPAEVKALRRLLQ